ncbi:hypothetical protein [Polaromonas sp. YR568]|uniref:hypothetical protein n=1 Tax=Polaromonas sp. YR568 TaxID=1855301 RepID=UPI00111386EC|nr:hypothetical protein [Polaromonas sp. YR568]
MRRMAAAALLALGGLSTQAGAGSATGSFNVNINLMVPASPNSGLGQVPATSGFCTSESLSQASNALVTVVCGTGQFVSIRPMPGKPFTGTHGGAFRYIFGPGMAAGPSTNSQLNPYVGTGTVTSLRVLDISGQEGILEFLVSF